MAQAPGSSSASRFEASDFIRRALEASATLKQAVARTLSPQIEAAAQALVDCYRRGGKVLLFGNGGSAADAQHLAGELVGRFLRERPSLPAIALTVNPSVLTAIANDSDFSLIFARQLEGLAQPGDVVVALSTSGASVNVIRGLRVARERGCLTVGLSGQDGGLMAELCHILIAVPSRQTPRIQEAHLTIGHIICGLAEQALFGPSPTDGSGLSPAEG